MGTTSKDSPLAALQIAPLWAFWCLPEGLVYKFSMSGHTADGSVYYGGKLLSCGDTRPYVWRSDVGRTRQEIDALQPQAQVGQHPLGEVGRRHQ